MNGSAHDDELHRQYDRALSEYRFQVDLNWRRSEYFFVLNVGVLVAAATMFSSEDVPRPLVAVLFLIGALLAGMSILANEAQHKYYRAARDLKQTLEKRLELEELAIVTTQGMGSSVKQLGRVRTFLKIMLIAIALADLGGAAFAIDDVRADTDPHQEAARVVVLRFERSEGEGSNLVIVVSRNGVPVESKLLKASSQRLLLKLRPSRYLVSIGGRKICRRSIEVSRDPLQRVRIKC